MADAQRVRDLVARNPGLLGRIAQNGGLLTLAVRHGHLEMVRLLLDRGTDVDERTMLQELEEPTLTWGMPLWHAALANHYHIAKLLLGAWRRSECECLRFRLASA